MGERVAGAVAVGEAGAACTPQHTFVIFLPAELGCQACQPWRLAEPCSHSSCTAWLAGLGMLPSCGSSGCWACMQADEDGTRARRRPPSMACSSNTLQLQKGWALTRAGEVACTHVVMSGSSSMGHSSSPLMQVGRERQHKARSRY